MNALTFWETAGTSAALGFAVGWLCGMFLGLWAYVTLGL